MRNVIYSNLPGDIDMAGLGTTLWEWHFDPKQEFHLPWPQIPNLKKEESTEATTKTKTKKNKTPPCLNFPWLFKNKAIEYKSSIMFLFILANTIRTRSWLIKNLVEEGNC